MGEVLGQDQSYTTVLSKDECQSQESKLLTNPFWYLNYYVQDEDGFTHLHIALLHSPATNSFVERLIDVTWPASLLNIVNEDGMTVLHVGATGNEPAIVRQLLVAGASPTIGSNGGYTPLHYAAMKNNIAMIDSLTRPFNNQEIEKMKSKKLIIPDLSKTINMRNNEGVLPLHFATRGGHLDAMQLLLELGADINVADYRNGDRPLHVAIKEGHKHITQFLLDYYQKHPDENLKFLYYDYLTLIKHLKEMELDEEFNETFKTSIEEMYPICSSDSE